MAETNVNDGGVAYPQPRDWMEQGLTVRDVFAAHAMAGIASTPPDGETVDELAQTAYVIADAMIRVRARDYATAAAASLTPIDRPLEFDAPER